MTHSAALISTEELARRMGAHGLRIFDCTTYLRPRPEGGYNAESGRANYDKGHIPGAGFLDLGGELSDQTSDLRFTLPPLDELTRAFAAKGIGHGTFVVLYSHASPVWATRIWWMLRAVGFDDAAILDGGLDKWKAENRPLSTEATTYPPATLTLRGRPEIFVDKNDVAAAIGKSDTLTLNALSHEQHKGSGGVTYGRAGPHRGLVLRAGGEPVRRRQDTEADRRAAAGVRRLSARRPTSACWSIAAAGSRPRSMRSC